MSSVTEHVTDHRNYVGVRVFATEMLQRCGLPELGITALCVGDDFNGERKVVPAAVI